jgi:hypothetical protein
VEGREKGFASPSSTAFRPFVPPFAFPFSSLGCFHDTLSLPATRPQKGEDALTWYFAPHRNDFSFRSRMFGGFPEIIRQSVQTVSINEWHAVEVRLTRKEVSYSVDGEEYAVCKLTERDGVADEGFVGFVSYASPWEARNLHVDRGLSTKSASKK